jgi:hypothetical protein
MEGFYSIMTWGETPGLNTQEVNNPECNRGVDLLCPVVFRELKDLEMRSIASVQW